MADERRDYEEPVQAEPADGAEDADQPESEPGIGNELDLSRVRDLVLTAHPDVVPEMVQGESFDELMASVDAAREAYRRIVDQAGKQPASSPRVVTQPERRAVVTADMERLSPLGKISSGLRRR